MEFTFHPASGLFPLMGGVELQNLADDIRAHGLLEPVVLYEGQVLDGRNRLRACELAGVEPQTIEWDAQGASPTEWVVSKNLHRRHLTTAQRAALALDLLPHLEAEAEKRRMAGLKRGDEQPVSPETDERGRSDEKAADLVGVGRSTVAAAKAIQQRDPEIVNEMRSGDLPTVAAAARAAGFETLAGAKTGSVAAVDNGDRTSHGRVNPIHYGKGDKFDEAIQPAVRYFRAWAKREYRFAHLNPKEARKRLRTLEELSDAVALATADLSARADAAKLRV